MVPKITSSEATRLCIEHALSGEVEYEIYNLLIKGLITSLEIPNVVETYEAKDNE